MDGFETVIAFAFAAIPGVLVVEMLELGRPRLRERHGAQSVAVYLIVSASVWTLAAVLFDVDGRLATVIDSVHSDGRVMVAAYLELAWRLVLAAVLWAVVFRSARRLLERFVRLGPRSPFAWDVFMSRTRGRSRTQAVHVRLRDGGEIFGVLASRGGADFHAEGRGLVLDTELVSTGEILTAVPGSNGIFIAPEAVATVAVMDYETVNRRAKVGE